MDALMIRAARGLAAALACAAAAGAAFAAGQETPPPAAVAAPAADDPAGLIAAAEQSFASADFEKVRDFAQSALARLESLEGAPTLDRLRLEARALDLLAQAQYNLGDRAAMGAAVEKLLGVDPSYRVDPTAAGARYADLYEARRRKLVGAVALSCAPLPCETATVDGKPAVIDAEGKIAALAGQRTIVVGRRNFREATLGPIKVAAGEKAAAQATLEQVSRDLAVTTTPAGARILVDGKEVGATQPGAAPDGPSAPLVVPGLLPGPHAVAASAPCFRRVEQSVDVVLDAQNLQAQDAGTLALERARGVLQLDWNGPAGTLTIGGQPAKPGPAEVCPGRHEVSLTVGGRRVWFGAFDVKDEEQVQVVPRPRPTLAVVREAGPHAWPGPLREAWNVVPLAPSAAEGLAAAVAERLGEAIVPVYPAAMRLPAPGLAAKAKAAAPEADLVALALPGKDPIRRARALVFLDPNRDVLEATAWPEGDAKIAAALAEELDRPLAWSAGLPGLDVADRGARPPIVASVLPGGPAAKEGIVPGMVLLAVAGRPVASGVEAAAALAALAPRTPTSLKVSSPSGERDVPLVPLLVVDAPSPAALRARPGLLLAPFVAKAEVARIAGDDAQRVAGGLLEGLALAALGLDEEAAAALDRAGVDEALDPAQDARGTAGLVLERLLRKLGRADYAAEVHARWAGFDRARFGGRGGPPLGAALDAPLD